MGSTRHCRRQLILIAGPVVGVVVGGYLVLHHIKTQRHCTAVAASQTSSTSEPSINALQRSADQLVPPPSGSTGNATAITGTSATLNGEAMPNGEATQVYFQYGPTTEYGTKTTSVDIGSSSAAVPASAGIAGLAPSTGYHYQEIIETPTHLLYGADESFTTHSSSAAPATSTSLRAVVPASEQPSTPASCK